MFFSQLIFVKEQHKRSPKPFFYLSLKSNTLDSNLKNKGDTLKEKKF